LKINIVQTPEFYEIANPDESLPEYIIQARKLAEEMI
jgi:hypothetical protein